MTLSKNAGPARNTALAAYAEQLRDQRILIADDCPVSRLITGAALRRHGAVVEEAIDGGQALIMTQERGYSFILMDVQMPICDGLEATRAIRAAGFRALPIIAISASLGPKEIAAVTEAGVNDALPKPLSLERLCHSLARLKARPASKAGEEPLVSAALLQELSGGDDAFAQRLLRIVAQELPAALEQMRQAFAQQDGALMARTSHRIRPCFASLKLSALQEAALRIEVLAKEGSMNAEIQRLMTQLAEGIDSVLSAVSRLRAAV